MKVVEGKFGKEAPAPGPEELLELLKEEVDLSVLTDLVVLVGDEESFSVLTNLSIAETNLLLDRAKGSMV